MKHAKKKKQAKLQAQLYRQMKDFLKAFPAAAGKDILWQMLKFSISKPDMFITPKQRSNMIGFYRLLVELLANSQHLLQKTFKKQNKKTKNASS